MASKEDGIMPDSNAVLSVLFPQERELGEMNKQILAEYAKKFLSRYVLMEVFRKVDEKTEQVWSIMQGWWHADPRYFDKYSDSAKDKENKRRSLSEDLKETRALSDEQIGSIIFVLNQNRPPGEIDQLIQEFLDEMFHRLKIEFVDHKIYPRAHVFPSQVLNKNLLGIVDFWVQTRYRTFYMVSDRIEGELDSSSEIGQCNGTIRNVSQHCPLVGGVHQADKRVLAEYTMIKNSVNGLRDFIILTNDKLLRILGKWSQNLNCRPAFRTRTTREESCLHSCANRPTCSVGAV